MVRGTSAGPLLEGAAEEDAVAAEEDAVAAEEEGGAADDDATALDDETAVTDDDVLARDEDEPACDAAEDPPAEEETAAAEEDRARDEDVITDAAEEPPALDVWPAAELPMDDAPDEPPRDEDAPPLEPAWPEVALDPVVEPLPVPPLLLPLRLDGSRQMFSTQSQPSVHWEEESQVLSGTGRQPARPTTRAACHQPRPNRLRFMLSTDPPVRCIPSHTLDLAPTAQENRWPRVITSGGSLGPG